MSDARCTAGRASAGPICALTGLATKPVARSTVLHHVRPDVAGDVREGAYGFCDVPSCDVVYIGDAGLHLRTADLRTRVGLKMADDPIPICYCWSFTKRQIVDDVRTNGRSTVRDYIRRQVQAGRCACEPENPSGRCCLGEVARAITNLP